MLKENCYKCGRQAQWFYMPGNENSKEDYVCDWCVKRKCSCRDIIGSDDEEQEKDKLGRFLPCLEYWFCENGFDKEIK